MCCFSGPVDSVSSTKIFARAARDHRQFLVYSMQLNAPEAVAMILPLPVPKNAAENAVRFINLEKYPEFFTDLASGYPVSRAKNDKNKDKAAGSLKLEVVKVGSFEASFVPAVKDFVRLDERFRLPVSVWDKLPQYKDYGFAVFQLKKGEQKVHPMAFEFPRAKADHLFFPTVHIHDGTVHAKARFDHVLYCQKSAHERLRGWEETPQPVGMYVRRIADSQGILDPQAHCYRRTMRGELRNDDTLV